MNGHLLIVGAGIAGLTLAQALRREGIRTTVIEKETDFRTAGAGILLGSNAVRVLDRLGLGEAARQQARVLNFMRLTDPRGRALQHLGTEPYTGNGPTLALHRAALQRALLTGLENEVRYGLSVQAIDHQPGGVEVQFCDGRWERYDAVVGADGLRSIVRSLCLQHQSLRNPLSHAGYTTWRAVVDGRTDAAGAVEMWGQGRRLGIVPLWGDLTYLYFTANLTLQGRSMSPLPGTASELRAFFADFVGPATDALALLSTETPLIRTGAHEVRLRHWVQGRAALIGDAAHAMTPNLGQGAAMGIEDAYVLARTLGSGSDVSWAFQEYERLRYGRVTRIQQQARWLGRLGQLERSSGLNLRNAGMRAMPPILGQHNHWNVAGGGPVPAVR